MSTSTPEVERHVTRSPVECRSVAGKPRTIGGYAAVFDSESRMLPAGFKETVSKTFFNKAKGDGWPGMAGMGVLARYDHRPEFLLGNSRSGTLELTIDNHGLFYQVALPESRSDIYELVERGDVPGSSFEMVVMDDEWDYVHGVTQRTLLSGNVLDVGPTSTPAYASSTAVAYRSFARAFDADVTEVERDFRAGNTRKYFERTDIMPKPSDMPRANVTEERTITHEDRQAWLAARKPAEGLTPQQVWLEMKGREIRYDRMMTEYMGRQRQVYAPTDQQAAHAAQQSAIMAEALRRRVNQLHEAGHDVPNTSTGSQWLNPPVVVGTIPTTRPPVHDDPWLGT